MSTRDYVTVRYPVAHSTKVERLLLAPSLLGRFVRKCRLDYIKLDFQQSGLLWNCFKTLRATGNSDATDLSNTNFTTEDLERVFGCSLPETIPSSTGRHSYPSL
jgi:hypothetical protein